MELKQQTSSAQSICSIRELCRIAESRHMGCVVLNGSRRVMLVGPLARRVLERGGLRIGADSALETERPDQEPALQRALDDAATQRRPRIPLIALNRGGCVSPLIVAISTVQLQDSAVTAAAAESKPARPALSSANRRLFNGGAGPYCAGGKGFALWLRDPLWFDSGSLEELMDVFGLTRRESELTLHLASGGDLAQFAEMHQLSINTVKSHLKQAFVKVGVNAQAQLIANVHCLLH